MNANTINMDLLPSFRRSSAISLTPLIDVVFILLMFFMLTTSFVKERQLELSSPVASTEATVGPGQRVWLDSLGNLRLESSTAPAVADKVLSAEIDPRRAVIVSPAAGADVQGIVSALTRLKGLGFQEISLGRPYSDTE